MNQLTTFRIACVLGLLSVVLGAFGAHALKEHLKDSPNLLNAFEVGVRYQFYHALALLAVSFASEKLWENKNLSRACISWLIGILLFSGSLYTMAITGNTKLGIITPFGGLAMITGWIFLLLSRKK